MTFGEVFSRRRRMVVVHHTHLLKNITERLKRGDLVFFDDCLYSQYVFLEANVDKLSDMGVSCVLGLSPKAMRPSGNPGIYSIESGELHRVLNSNVETIADSAPESCLNGFMSEVEVKRLLDGDNVFLALHGCCHLKLENTVDKFRQPIVFRKDVEDGKHMLRDMGLDTNIFVYPYAYVPFLGDMVLRQCGFTYVFAGNGARRTPIEEISYGF